MAARARSRRPRFFLLALALPGLLLGEAMARGRGLLRGCAWAFGALVARGRARPRLRLAAMAERAAGPVRAPALGRRSSAELQAGGLPADRIAEFTEQVGAVRDVLAVVFPAVWVICRGVLVAANAALLRLYLLRRDPGWLEDGEFERRALAPRRSSSVFVLAGAAVAAARGAAGRLQRAAGARRSSSRSRGWRWSPSTPGAWPPPPLLRAAVLVLVLVNPWAPQILALLGLFDIWFDFRRWAEPPPGATSGPGLEPA